MGPLEAVFVVVAAGIWLAFGFVCSSVAQSKNRSTGAWFLLGLLFPLLALLFIAVLPPLHPTSTTSASEPAPDLPAEGWYADPEVDGELRWWDGQRWTGATKPVERVEA